MNAVKLKGVCRKMACGPATVYRRLDPKSKYFDPRFPRPRKDGPRGVVWLDEELDEYLRGLPTTIPSSERSETARERRKKALSKKA